MWAFATLAYHLYEEYRTMLRDKTAIMQSDTPSLILWEVQISKPKIFGIVAVVLILSWGAQDLKKPDPRTEIYMI
ncbi:unnamed protein product [Fusarium graminearum]|uniref:Chromosome 1, complete genome n=2 Tax=Gibberella zeae TaxID=5518 RepID=A0A098D360_GIBZE|nr:unnamed protein product [Fusarium graminearum]CAF3597512.1 unnamed protein product [Fusarium graminearum]CAG2004397.1 unnamed protein product [Fusarium graminearum]CAG2009110.1 unnamed protein product [Fusarium graminearum]CEF73378.1 unnamed protein product [Fusarium graminearum]